MKKRWLGITILIPNDYSESISNFLFEQGATGIEEIEEVSGKQRIRAYFIQDGREERILRAINKYIKSLKSFDPEISLFEMETISIPEKDWASEWRRFFKPFRLFSKFLIKPPWAEVRIKKGEIPVNIFPAMAFGTGTHPTTKLCIKALDMIIKRNNISVLDIGTGSGILSIISAKLGAKVVWGVDRDEIAVENAIKNVEDNGLLNIVKIKKGSVGTFRRKFDIIVSNIDLKTLKRLSHSISKRVNKDGFLILSGVLETEVEELKKHYLEGNKFILVKTLKDKEWVCLVLKRL